MKKALIILLLIPVFLFSQTTDTFDFIAPLSDGLAAVKKNNQWGFLNEKGNLVIPFRDDLVLTETNGSKYPIFRNNRCLISKTENNIPYFGYIDKSGKVVIEPQFLNASNFIKNSAFALKLVTEVIGENELLGKRMVYHRYFEVIIDLDGNVNEYLSDPINVVLDKKFFKKTPEITSKFISDKLVATMNKEKKWHLTAYQ